MLQNDGYSLKCIILLSLLLLIITIITIKITATFCAVHSHECVLVSVNTKYVHILVYLRVCCIHIYLTYCTFFVLNNVDNVFGDLSGLNAY